MRFQNVVSVAAVGLVATVEATGHAKVVNKCSFPVFLYSVGGSGPGPVQELGSSTGAYEEPFRTDPSSGGITLKLLRSSQGLYNGSALLQFDYTLQSSVVWYDLSSVYGSPFSGFGVVEAPSDASCATNTWPAGVSTGSDVHDCGSGSNLTVTVCA